MDPRQLCLNTGPKASIMIPSKGKRLNLPGHADRHSTELFSCWAIWKENKRPGPGSLASCLFIIWFSLTRLCPFFTPSSPEHSPTLAGVLLLHALYPNAGKFLGSHMHSLLAFCSHTDFIVPAPPPPISFSVPVDTMISSAEGAKWHTAQIRDGHPL